jgi:hypothetical protein
MSYVRISGMRSDHSKQRGEEGRPVQVAFNDAQRARQADVFVQPDGRYVVRGLRGREHIFETSGELVTSLVRPQKAHQRKVIQGERQFISIQQFEQFQEIFK